MDMVGKHCILELYDCDSSKLDDEVFLRSAITQAAERAGATLLNLITHQFQPQGVTGLALLAESHISIHTWPEAATPLWMYSPVVTTPCRRKPAPYSAKSWAPAIKACAASAAAPRQRGGQ